MTYFDDIYESAVDNHYLITTAGAAALDIPGIELVKLAKRRRLEALGNGVYRIARYVPDESDPYAIAVARVGKGAYLWGESVIALLGLAPTNPDRIFVATPRRVRRNLPKEIVLIRVATGEGPTTYEGVPSQRLSQAIRSCKDTIMPERLQMAVRRAKSEGYVTASEENELKEALGW